MLVIEIFKGIVSDFSVLQYNGFFLLPSSTNEFLAVGADIEDAHGLARMVADINRTVVAPEEILSDHIFTLDREGQLSVVV